MGAIRILVLLIRDRGELAAENLALRREYPRTAVGYLGHATLLSGELTARENLIFAGRLHGVAQPAARADRLLDEEGLADVATRRAGAFSRGRLSNHFAAKLGLMAAIRAMKSGVTAIPSSSTA